MIEAEVKFPGLFAIPFELACLCAQIGELKEAEQWLKKAMALDEKMTRQALDVLDLKPLMDSMGGTTWINE